MRQLALVLLFSVGVWALVFLAAWFADNADNSLGHGPLPTGVTTINAYFLTLISGALGLVVGGAMIIGVRGGAYYARRYSWLAYVLVVLPLVVLLFVPLERFGSDSFLGLPSLLVGVPGRMVIATSLGALLLGVTGLRTLFRAPADEGASAALTQRAGGAIGSRDVPGRFTGLAWRALSFMQEEAKRFEQSNMGTEHLLLGLLSDSRSQASRVVVELGAEPSSLKREIEGIIGRRGALLGSSASMTQRCQRVIERAVRISRNSGLRTVGTGHLLQALVESADDVASQLLHSSGVTADRVAASVRQMPAEAD